MDLIAAISRRRGESSMIDRVLDGRVMAPDHFDWRFLGLIAAILSLGVLSIYSVTPVQSVGGTPVYLKQLAWIALGYVAFVAMLVMDYHKISRLAYILYALVLILLVVVLVAGKTSRGAQRWIPIGPFVFQPSEFAKLVLVLTLATYYTKSPRQGWMQRVVMPGLIMLPGLLLILKQPDLGSGLAYFSIYAYRCCWWWACGPRRWGRCCCSPSCCSPSPGSSSGARSMTTSASGS